MTNNQHLARTRYGELKQAQKDQADALIDAIRAPNKRIRDIARARNQDAQKAAAEAINWLTANGYHTVVTDIHGTPAKV